eukprot:COSAG06_NODE_995_length_11158_cov_10.796184_9_plen_204_part_00
MLRQPNGHTWTDGRSWCACAIYARPKALTEASTRRHVRVELWHVDEQRRRAHRVWSELHLACKHAQASSQSHTSNAQPTRDLPQTKQCKATKQRTEARQGKARQGKARQGKARQGKARQGKAIPKPLLALQSTTVSYRSSPAERLYSARPASHSLRKENAKHLSSQLFLLCLSQACLGKLIVCTIPGTNGIAKEAFRSPLLPR